MKNEKNVISSTMNEWNDCIDRSIVEKTTNASNQVESKTVGVLLSEESNTAFVQPFDRFFPLRTMITAIEEKFFYIAGLTYDSSTFATETRRRIHIVSERIFCAEKELMLSIPFTSEQLVKLTAYIDAMPKSLGFDYMPVLQREAGLLIPEAIEHPLDESELLRSFFIWRRNYYFLHNTLLGVGLFLLFFHTVIKNNFYRAFRYDLVIDAVMYGQNEMEICMNVKRLIQEALRGNG